MRLGWRQKIGIVGMALAVAGAVAWFYGQNIIGIFAWVAAFLIVMRLNKRQSAKS